ncbi:MAG: HyaD/HybD family hydrogenase maturation endopeptidase [Candidatus Omnitrophota bacterium]
MSGRKITVLGIGNLLLKDEGVGIHAINALKKEMLPKNVELVDGGVAGFDLLPIVESCDKLIVIDAIKTSDAPGTIYKFDPQHIDIQKDANISLHDMDFFQVLEFAKKHKRLPLTQMIAVVPKEIEAGMDLTPELQEKIPEIVALIKEEINSKAV